MEQVSREFKFAFQFFCPLCILEAIFVTNGVLNFYPVYFWWSIFTFNFRSKPNDPVGNTVGDLVNLLKKPENMAKMEDQKKTLPKMTTLNVDDCDIAALVDAIGDQMSKK